MLKTFSEETPLAMLTIGQLREILADIQKPAPEAATTAANYVYGLQGIQGLFNVSKKTAQRYKDGILRDAVMQSGRKLVIDVDKAMALFAQSGRVVL